MDSANTSVLHRVRTFLLSSFTLIVVSMGVYGNPYVSLFWIAFLAIFMSLLLFGFFKRAAAENYIAVVPPLLFSILAMLKRESHIHPDFPFGFVLLITLIICLTLYIIKGNRRLKGVSSLAKEARKLR